VVVVVVTAIFRCGQKRRHINFELFNPVVRVCVKCRNYDFKIRVIVFVITVSLVKIKIKFFSTSKKSSDAAVVVFVSLVSVQRYIRTEISSIMLSLLNIEENLTFFKLQK